jgi:hypothetical protein
MTETASRKVAHRVEPEDDDVTSQAFGRLI